VSPLKNIHKVKIIFKYSNFKNNLKNIKNMIKKLIRKIYYKYFLSYFSKKIKIFKNHKNYENYIERQKQKTLDPNRIKKWTGVEWEIKLDGFRKLFHRNQEFVKDTSSCICLGSRTGQEVKALQELKKKAIGIDLVEFPPYTVIGDIHNLNFQNNEFDLVFTNIFDHSIKPDKFVSEMERVCMTGGYIIINLQLKTPGDEFSENIVYDVSEVIKMFKKSKTIKSRTITNSFDAMNHELVMKKN